jgi:hypothetical protein
MATTLRAGQTGVRIPVGTGNFLISKTSRKVLVGPASLYSNGYRGSFPEGKAAGA